MLIRIILLSLYAICCNPSFAYTGETSIKIHDDYNLIVYHKPTYMSSWPECRLTHDYEINQNIIVVSKLLTCKPPTYPIPPLVSSYWVSIAITIPKLQKGDYQVEFYEAYRNEGSNDEIVYTIYDVKNVSIVQGYVPPKIVSVPTTSMYGLLLLSALLAILGFISQSKYRT